MADKVHSGTPGAELNLRANLCAYQAIRGPNGPKSFERLAARGIVLNKLCWNSAVVVLRTMQIRYGSFRSSSFCTQVSIDAKGSW
jgi:hypothetical protein